MSTISRIKLRRDTAANWVAANPVLSQGEIGVELASPVNRVKVGDGTNTWSILDYIGALVPTSSRGTPASVSAAGGITPSQILRELQFIVGSPGPVVVTANPQIAIGTAVGQELLLICPDAVNSVTLANGNGLALNGPCTLISGGSLSLIWDGTLWNEVCRNDI